MATNVRDVVRKQGTMPIERPAKLQDFVRVTPDTKLGLYTYAFLMPLMGMWSILSAMLNPKGMQKVLVMLKQFATLAWLRDDRVVALHVEGMSVDALLAKLRIGINVKGGLGKVSKRLSRIFRPYALFAWTDTATLRMKYVTRGIVRQSSQDGGYIISRHYLRRMAHDRAKAEFDPIINNVSNSKAERDHAKRAKANLIWMANHATRVEVTIMTRDGQWKGHAIVVDSKKADVWLIEGQVKKDIYMTTDDVFVGLNVVHTSKLFLDQQSFTNLDVNGFFRTDPEREGNRLVRWMREYLQSYITAFEKGEYVEKIIDHLDEAKYREDTEKFLGFWLYDVVARGGDPKWFAHWTKAFLRQALQHVNARMNGRISLPIPGLNLYVFPASAVHMNVRRGHCVIDRERCTIWVNDVDLFTLDPRFSNVYELQAWLDTHSADDLQPGLQKTWGGSDCDDMMRVVQFVDVADNNARKCLVWRSPNKLGEFAVLNFQSGDDLPWADGSVWIKADSRLLPQPAQWQHTKYHNLITDYDVEKPTKYSIGGVWAMAKLMVQSAGALGMYCLGLRFEVSTRACLPDDLPCSVEEVTDAQVKDFRDTSGVKQFVRTMGEALAAWTRDGKGAVARAFAGEFERFLGDDGPDFVVSDGTEHWIDEAVFGCLDEIKAYEERITEYVDQAMPPAELYTHGMKWADAGRRFGGVFGRTWRDILGDQEDGVEAEAEFEPADFSLIEDVAQLVNDQQAEEERERNFDTVREACLEFLSGFPRSEWPRIMVGFLASRYMQWWTLEADSEFQSKNAHLRDSAAWQLGQAHPYARPDGVEVKNREEGLDKVTIAGLVEIGLLAEWQFDADDNLIFSQAESREVTKTFILSGHGAWLNTGVALGILPVGVTYQQVNALTRREAGRAITTEQRCKNAVAKMDLTGKVFEVDVYEYEVRGEKVEVPALFSAANGNLLCTLGRSTDVEALPEKVRILRNHTDSHDVMWIVCEAAE